MPTRHAAAALLVVITTATGAAACGSSSSGGEKAAGQPTSSANPQPSDCPTPPANSQAFPPGASSDLPRPDFATSPESLPVDVKGVTLLRFTTAMPLRDAASFVLKRYPAAGYRLLEGDSEGDEADVPFVNGQVHGKTRLSGTGACTTTWLVAVTSGNATLDKVPGLHSHDH